MNSTIVIRVAGRPTAEETVEIMADFDSACLAAQQLLRYAPLGHSEWLGGPPEGDHNRAPHPELQCMANSLVGAVKALAKADHHLALYFASAASKPEV